MTSIVYRSVELQVDFRHFPGAHETRHVPAEPETAVLFAVEHCGEDLLPLLSVQARAGIAAECIKHWHEENDNALIDRRIAELEGV